MIALLQLFDASERSAVPLRAIIPKCRDLGSSQRARVGMHSARTKAVMIRTNGMSRRTPFGVQCAVS